jgi:hypothetical protein
MNDEQGFGSKWLSPKQCTTLVYLPRESGKTVKNLGQYSVTAKIQTKHF